MPLGFLFAFLFYPLLRSILAFPCTPSPVIVNHFYLHPCNGSSHAVIPVVVPLPTYRARHLLSLLWNLFSTPEPLSNWDYPADSFHPSLPTPPPPRPFFTCISTASSSSSCCCLPSPSSLSFLFFWSAFFIARSLIQTAVDSMTAAVKLSWSLRPVSSFVYVLSIITIYCCCCCYYYRRWLRRLFTVWSLPVLESVCLCVDVLDVCFCGCICLYDAPIRCLWLLSHWDCHLWIY